MTEDLEARLGHRFAKPELLTRALTHSSDAESRGEMLLSNERLEFVGDRVLGLCIAEWLAERFPTEREGDLAKRLAVLVAAETLCKVAEELELSGALRMPARYRATGLMGPRNLLSDALEAVLGALYLDGGLGPARALIRRYWARLIEADLVPPVSPKNRLQEWTLGRGLGLPVYGLVQASGPAHAPHFVTRVLAAGREAQGEGDSKRAAEQAAAAAWLRELKE
ncbi:MAG: ribonuclease [Pseudomonadota bacterium]|jgi:ribonuclease-3